MNTVIFDLDGTLCDISHRLHHIKGGKKDWEAFHAGCVNDVPKLEIIELFKRLDTSMRGGPLRTFIVSGRSDKVMSETQDWLYAQGVYPDDLIMRPDGDYNPDHELKRRWLNEGKFGPKEDILFCVDDRQRVVDMWRQEGLTCLQCAAWSEE